MAKNCLRITHQGQTIQVSWLRGQAAPRFAEPVVFQHPFDKQALIDLRWYLEEYLHFPYGIFPDEAAKIEQKLQVWGEELFELVFRGNEKTREFFQAATYDGLDNCELVITSDDSAILNLPWELLYSPVDGQFLAPSLAGMSRSLSNYAVRGEMPTLPQDKLNILLVIARPYGDRDIALKTIARPLLDSISQIRHQVNIKVLRPPSFEQFERELSANKGFYHIVHFDGHGDFDPNSQGFQHALGGSGQGVLVFEALDGSEQIITAAQIAQNLADCGVPIFVLNACKSAQEGEDKFSSVATRLVSSGAKSVVAMAYSIYAVAAKHFIGRLYGELVRGANLSQAVTAGRKEALNHPQRPSPKGDKPLQDWLVPVLYQQESYVPFIPDNSAEVLSIDAFLEQETVTQLIEFPDEGAYGFVGRDYDILRLERAFRQNNIVLLQGMGGVGKTELSCGFARWLEETQGRAGKMFFVSFEYGASLNNVIGQVGREVWKDQLDKFNSLPIDKQQALVLKYLQEYQCLLIWDNFEPVNGFPTGNEPLLIEEQRNELKQFLKKLRSGKTWVLITSRREEPWLDCGYTILQLGGLLEQEVEELASKILQTAGVDKSKLSQEYLELLKLLRGHPLSLRVVLPHLKTQTPLQLIEALRQGLDTFTGEEEEGRDKSLTVSLDYSFSKLSEKARRHLPFLGLFSQRVNVDLLHAFSKSSDDEYGKAYQAVFGDNLSKDDWLAILNEAAATSIVEHLGSTIYIIHPALPWYLRKRLNQQVLLEINPQDNTDLRVNSEVDVDAQQKIAELEKKLLIFYAGFANYYDKQLIKNAQLATFILQLEEPNLLQNLHLAEQQQEWKYAKVIFQALQGIYQRLARRAELKALLQIALNEVGIDLKEAKAKGKNAFEFWMYLQFSKANEAISNGEFEAAKIICQEILDELIALNDSSQNFEISSIYHTLGIVAHEQRQFEQARQYFLKALKISEDALNWHNIAASYHELGMTAQEQRQFEQARQYFLKALKIYQDFRNWYTAANQYHHLGIIALEQKQYEQARQYFSKALKVYEGFRDWYSAAREYHELGILALKQKQFEQARQYFFKALRIKEDAGYLHSAGTDYLCLALLAEEQGKFEEAISYWQKAFYIYKQFEDWYRALEILTKWGRTLEAQSNFSDALQIYIIGLSITINNEINEFVREYIFALALMLKVLGESQFDTIWNEMTGQKCEGELRDLIWKVRDDLDAENQE